MRDNESIGSALEAFADSLRASDVGDCIDVERLTDWADGSMPKAERTAVLDHIAVCPACSGTAVELVRMYAPVKVLHEGWLGTRGPLLRATGALRRDRVLSHAYEEHLKHCPVCERKAERLANLGRLPAMLFGIPHPALRAAAVAAFAFLIIVVPRITTAPNRSGSTSYPDEARSVTEATRPKGGSAQEAVDQSLLDPDILELDEAIGFWERESNNNRNRVALAALVELYRWKSDIATTPEERRRWADLSDRATQQLGDLRRHETEEQPFSP